jgi:UDPglucose 6-dehydrogenase
MREAPSLVLIADLLARGAAIRAYDPVATHEAQRILGANPRISYAATPMEALDGADALAIVTEWKEFRSPDFDAIKAKLKTPVIFDGRNLYDPPRRARRGSSTSPSDGHEPLFPILRPPAFWLSAT